MVAQYLWEHVILRTPTHADVLHTGPFQSAEAFFRKTADFFVLIYVRITAQHLWIIAQSQLQMASVTQLRPTLLLKNVQYLNTSSHHWKLK